MFAYFHTPALNVPVALGRNGTYSYKHEQFVFVLMHPIVRKSSSLIFNLSPINTVILSGLDITIIRGLKNVEVFEDEDVTFECKVSHDNATDVEWKLQDASLESNEMNEISVEKGRVHMLKLKKVTQQDSGTVTFRVGPYTSTAQLTVKGNEQRQSPSEGFY